MRARISDLAYAACVFLSSCIEEVCICWATLEVGVVVVLTRLVANLVPFVAERLGCSGGYKQGQAISIYHSLEDLGFRV